MIGRRVGISAPSSRFVRDYDIGRNRRGEPSFAPIRGTEFAMSSKLLAVMVAALVLYVGSYIGFRGLHIEVWPRDQHAYVIFPEGYGALLYYAWRPLSYVDGALTGMRFHIGPHR